MSRTAQILAGITKDMRGIEVAPWFAPLAPKREGFNCLAVDVFDRETLITRAKADPNIPAAGVDLIEEVDFVGSATEIADMVPSSDHGAFDYIVSSHNFEHLPNPIRFLQGCQRLLKEGGVISMAVPDARACFDHFRPHTTTVDWLVAFKQQRTKPSPEQIFEARAYISMLRQNDADIGAFSIDDDRSSIFATGDLAAEYRLWQAAKDADEYCDVHCSVMTPASFELLIFECARLGLVSLGIESISGPVGCEFYVRLVNRTNLAFSGNVNALRTKLMQRIWEERASAPTPAPAEPAPAPVRKTAQSLRKRISLRYYHPLKALISDRLRGGRPPGP